MTCQGPPCDLTCGLQRQKAAKRGGAKPAEEEADDADLVDAAPTADQFMAAHFASIHQPSTAAAAASQYPSGLPLPGQGLPAAAPAQEQTAGLPGTDCHMHHIVPVSTISAALLQRVLCR